MNTVLMLQDELIDQKITCTVTITTQSASCSAALVVDTGSAVSIIPEHLYREHFSDVSLSEPASRLVTYTKFKVPVLGCFSATVKHANAKVPATLYVVKTGTALLGLDLFRALRLIIDNNAVLPEAASSPTVTSSTAPVDEIKTGAAAEKLGLAKGFIHKVKIREDVQPVQQKLRRLPVSVRQAVSCEIERLLEMEVIERVDASPWVSPIVVTLRKNGKVRMCVDYREPNKAIVMDSHPLPHMDDIFSNMYGATVFSTIDLANAYHQVLLAEESRDITAFITHEGLFRFRRVPYGLCSAPSAFSKLMSLVLKGLKGVQNYLDDVIVYGRDQQEHDRNLQAVLATLNEAGLQLNMEKCHFNQKSLQFLGHVISAKGLLPNEDHLKAIAEAPAPGDATTLRSFLGLTAWYAKFVKNYASLVEPMRACLHTDTFKWTSEAQASFDAVKTRIINSPALAVFEPSLPTIVATDASDYGLGAILTQLHPDKTERTVAFASRSLTPAERKYSIVEKEALACVWAVEKWRTFLWGTRFTLRTDQRALTTLLATKGLGRAGMRIARWSARLLCFTYDVEYRAGAQNYAADCLSRLPLPSVENAEPVVEPELVALLDTELKALTVKDFTAACQVCPELTALREQMKQGWPKTAQSLPAMLQPYFAVRDELSVEEVIVYRGPYRRLVPVAVRKQIINLAHETHQGVVRTKQRLRDLYWWPYMDLCVEETIKACVTCQLNDKSAKIHPAPLHPIPFPDAPWQKVGIDIVGPFDSAAGDCRYAITLIDYYTKWPEVAFTPSITTSAITTFLSTIFSRFGNPTELISDNGTQFTSTEFADFLAVRDIKHRKVSLYYPQANGAIERWNRVLKETLLTAEQERKQWKPFIQNFLLTYRATPHSTTGVSPYELMFNRKMRTKMDIGLASTSPFPSEKQLRTRVTSKQKASKAYTDVKRGARVPQIREGSMVRVRK
uniref:Gypsy retrotransposon integrase-like protein 1 n=1 Tax=Oryzias latipes TaxID=8090 RepID=A0A3P9H5V6_ORYLA